MVVRFWYLSISRTFSSCPPREMTSFAVCERREPLPTNFQFLLAFSTKLLIFGNQITWKKPRSNCCRLRGCLSSWLEKRQIIECHRRWQRHKLLRMWLVEWGSISVLHLRHALCNNHVSSSYKTATRKLLRFYDNLRIQPYIFNSLCSIQRCALSGRGCTSLTL